MCGRDGHMKKSKLEKSRNRWGIVFILPQLISLVCLGIIPIVIAFVLSFFERVQLTGIYRLSEF